MKRVFLLVVVLALSVGYGETFIKALPGDGRLTLVCDDTAKLDNLLPSQVKAKYRSNIVLKCEATTQGGSAGVQVDDFSYAYPYSTGSKTYPFSNTDFKDRPLQADSRPSIFYITFPDTERPEIITLRYGDSKKDVYFFDY